MRTTVSWIVWAAAIRLGTVVAAYVLAFLSATQVVPVIGLYLYQQSGVATSATPVATNGLLAVWVVPFVFVVALLAVAEVALMRWLWRLGTRRIERLRARDTETTTQPAGQRRRRGNKRK